MILNTDEQIDYSAAIQELKREMNATILAHYYQEPEIQDIADFIGDSLELARRAKETTGDVIVFCGVHFMAETAKIVNPEKLVLLPDINAGCSLADSCPPNLFKDFRERHPDLYAVTYINCFAAVKALSDVICTSGNAEKIIRGIPADKKILFSPDRNLGKYLIKKTGREMVLWDGTCVVHETFNKSLTFDLKLQHPGAKIIAHPECEESLLEMADFIGSTSKLLNYIKEDTARSYIVVTEPGIIHQMRKSVPAKEYIPAPSENGCSCNNCPYMKLNSLEKIFRCMKELSPRIEMSEEIRRRAELPLTRMLEMS
jgi:quinolinate synthase